jgi:predicted acylesterase/phospholipase RssA
VKPSLKNCFGVFEGGGVRGAALGGAYEAAAQNGVRFGAVAGSSAGSIVAALIAAGATPSYVAEQLKKTQFRDLLGPPNPARRVFSNPMELGWAKRKLGSLFVSNLDELSVVLEHSGLYGTDKLEQWVNQMLRDVTGIARPVQFQDLEKPLFVVAADIRRRKPKVWTPRDKNTHVAFAVKCSCSIPLFFQAHVDGDAVYVDGGMLSNLPSFVFSLPDARELLQTRIAEIIAFRLTSSWNGTWEDVGQPRDIKDLLSSVTDTVVSGATEIQLSLQTETHWVEIPTGTVKTTDFDTITPAQVSELQKSGRESTDRAIKQLAAKPRPRLSRAFRGYDEFLLLLGLGLRAGGYAQLVILAKETRFIHFQFPAFLFALMEGLELRVLVEPSSEKTEKRCRELLSGLGATVTECSRLPWEGFLFRGNPNERFSALMGPVELRTHFEDLPVCCYQDPTDRPVLDTLEKTVDQLLEPAAAAASQLKIEPFNEGQLIALLKKVRQYGKAGITVEKVQLANLKVLDRYVKEFRVLSVETLIEEFGRRKIGYFDSCAAVLSDGRQSVIAPPVIERIGSELVVIEGTTRCFLALTQGQSEIQALVVEGANENICGIPRALKRVQTTSRTISIHDNIESYEPAAYRRIEEALHP